MAVQVVSGSAILLIVIHLSLSTPFITTPHPLLPPVFLLPSQNPRSAFQFSVFPFVNCDLPLPFRAQVRQVVGLLSVLSENVLHIIVDHPRRIRNFPPPPRVQCVLNGPNLRLVLLSPSHRVH